MRGNPYLRLRRTLARGLRRALVGSMALASLSIAIAVAGVVLLDAGEAGVAGLTHATRVAAATSETNSDAAPATIGPQAAAANQFELLTPDLGLRAPVAGAPPVVEGGPAALGDGRAGESTRRVAVAAIGQAAGPPPRFRDRLDAIALRDDTPEIVEPATLVAPSPEPTPLPSPPLSTGNFIEATVSFYYCELGDTADAGDGGGFCGAMRDGTVVYEGAAACAYVYLGQQFRIVGDPTERVYTCNDTGSAVHGLHRDIFFHQAADGWPWLAQVGTQVTLEILG